MPETGDVEKPGALSSLRLPVELHVAHEALLPAMPGGARPIGAARRPTSWPPGLFIPREAKEFEYWPAPAPDDHRYALEWTFPGPGFSQARASADTGTLFVHCPLDNNHPGQSQHAESGLGVYFVPTIASPVIHVSPTVECHGGLRTLTDLIKENPAGYVEVRAELIVGVWMQTSGGFQLLGQKRFQVATSGRVDSTYGPQEVSADRSFSGGALSAAFRVTSGVRYLCGVVNRISVASTLTKDDGRPLPPVSEEDLLARGSLTCDVSLIEIDVGQAQSGK